MAIFGGMRRNPYDIQMNPSFVPQGDVSQIVAPPQGIQGAADQPYDMGQVQVDMPDAQIPGRTGFFGKARDFIHNNKDTMSQLGAMMMASGGGSMGESGRQQMGQNSRHQDQIADQQHDMMLAKLRGDQERDGRFDTYGDSENGYFGRDGNGVITNLMPGHGPKPNDWQQRFDLYKGLSPDDRALFDQSGIGGGNSGYAFGQKREIKQTVPGKAPGAGGGGRPPGVTPTARSKAIAEAESAIARGADRATVYARLAKMGIQ